MEKWWLCLGVSISLHGLGLFARVRTKYKFTRKADWEMTYFIYLVCLNNLERKLVCFSHLPLAVCSLNICSKVLVLFSFPISKASQCYVDAMCHFLYRIIIISTWPFQAKNIYILAAPSERKGHFHRHTKYKGATFSFRSSQISPSIPMSFALSISTAVVVPVWSQALCIHCNTYRVAGENLHRVHSFVRCPFLCVRWNVVSFLPPTRSQWCSRRDVWQLMNIFAILFYLILLLCCYFRCKGSY